MKGENNMKKLLIFLFLCLLALTSCGKRTVNAHGKIIARETDENGRLISVVADTETNGTIRLILMENTHLDVPACFSEKDFLTDDSLYPFISTVYDARTGKNDTYENRKIRCYEAELIDMDIEKNNTPASTITLSDGTELRVYPDSDHTLYALANGTDLLLENHPRHQRIPWQLERKTSTIWKKTQKLLFLPTMKNEDAFMTLWKNWKKLLLSTSKARTRKTSP